MSRKQIFTLALAVIVVAGIVIGAIVLTSPGGPIGIPEHITIAQAMADRSGQAIKVGGDVVPGSISWSDVSQSISFALTGEGDRMQVVYQGRAPNDFKPGSPLVVEGTFNISGVFEAKFLTSRSSPLCKACHSN